MNNGQRERETDRETDREREREREKAEQRLGVTARSCDVDYSTGAGKMRGRPFKQ